MRTLQFVQRAMGALFLAALTACGGGGSDTPSSAATPVDEPVVVASQTVGPEGGSLSVQGLSLTLPSLALPAAVALTVQQEATGSEALARFRLSPAGQALQQPTALQYAAPGLPEQARFFWELDGERWMIPGAVVGGVLRSQVDTLGYAALPVAASAPSGGVMALSQALSARIAGVVSRQDAAVAEGAALVVQAADCAALVPALSARVRRAASVQDMGRAVALYNNLQATRQACAQFDAQVLQQSACEAVALAQANAAVTLADSFTSLRRIASPLFAGNAMVQLTGATCVDVDPAASDDLVATKFDQFLQVLQGQLTRGELMEEASARELRVLMDFEVQCQQLGLDGMCDRLTDQIYPDLLDGMRQSAFDACRQQGTPLAVSQFYALGSQRGNEDRFFDHGRFSLAAVEADLSYCGNPKLALKVFDGEVVPHELTERAVTVQPLVSLGNYTRTDTIEVPRDGSINISGDVAVLRCPNGSASGAALVVRINGQPWVTRQATGNGFSLALDAAPLLLDLPDALPALGIDPSTGTGFTVRVNREGGACQDGTQEVLNTPFTLFEVQVNFPETVVQTDSGQAHSCTVNTQGGVRCKGRNFEGQLGNGSFVGSATPVQVAGLSSGVQAVSVGGLHSCAILAGGVVKCWGNNSSGELGDGGTTRRATPVAVNGLGGGVRAIDLGSAFTCALTQGGGVHCWGVNNFGQLGSVTPDALKSLTPVGVEGLGSGVAAIAAGPLHACALTTEGTVKCWGFNGVGLLGNASVQQSATPLLVAGLRPGVTSISVSASASIVETCAAFGTGVRQCWGTRSAVPVDTP